MLTTDPEIKRIAKVAYPDYRGRKIRWKVQAYPLDCRSYWDGGSRTYFKFVRLADNAVVSMPTQSAFDKQIAGSDAVVIPEGFVCVTHSIFCGKDTGLTVYVNSTNVGKFLPEA